mmetsp:Transcript_14919/g.47879  ORF Transcript_14919/g.47879 Transcript_14919/m.47879 type:complete len:201 (-) Transcript_14919:501-1103(-)
MRRSARGLLVPPRLLQHLLWRSLQHQVHLQHHQQHHLLQFFVLGSLLVLLLLHQLDYHEQFHHLGLQYGHGQLVFFTGFLDEQLLIMQHPFPQPAAPSAPPASPLPALRRLRLPPAAPAHPPDRLHRAAHPPRSATGTSISRTPNSTTVTATTTSTTCTSVRRTPAKGCCTSSPTSSRRRPWFRPQPSCRTSSTARRLAS